MILIKLFCSKGLEHEWHFFRVECQARGEVHAHVGLRLKDEPGIAEFSQKMLETRKAERKLVMLQCPQVQEMYCKIGDLMEIECE